MPGIPKGRRRGFRARRDLIGWRRGEGVTSNSQSQRRLVTSPNRPKVKAAAVAVAEVSYSAAAQLNGGIRQHLLC